MTTPYSGLVHKKIVKRRLELNLDTLELAHRVCVSVDEYEYIETRDAEIYSVVPIYHVKKICDVLTLNFLELLELDCEFCKGISYTDLYWLRRNVLIEKRRKMLGLTQERLGDRIGFYESEVKNLETYTAHLESWVVENILWLGSVLQIPPQVLLDVKCGKCFR